MRAKFQTSTGTVVLTHLMPVRDADQSLMVPDHEIVRQVTCTSGCLEIDIQLTPRANYGETNPRIRDCGKLGMRIDNGYGVYWLRGTIPLSVSDSSVLAKPTLRSGETLSFSFNYTENAPAVSTIRSLARVRKGESRTMF